MLSFLEFAPGLFVVLKGNHQENLLMFIYLSIYLFAYLLIYLFTSSFIYMFSGRRGRGAEKDTPIPLLSQQKK